MSDSFSSKSGSKIKVMYVRGEEESKKRPNAWQERFKKSEQKTSFERADKAPEREDKTPADIKEPTMTPAQIRRQRQEETRIYGENACQAMFKCRPEGIVRGYFLQSVTPRFSDALRWMAANRKAYHVIDEAEMQKVAGSEHHGGVCFLIKKRSGISVDQYLAQPKKQDCVLMLDQIANPFNLGGVIRSAAFFGVNGIVVRNIDQIESGAALRTADGGMEHIAPIIADDFIATLDEFREKGYFIVALSTQAVDKEATPFTQVKLPSKTVILISQYSNSQLARYCDRVVSVKGTRRVESLNISVATGIILAQWAENNH